MRLTLNAFNGSFACAGVLTHTIETVLATSWCGARGGGRRPCAACADAGGGAALAPRPRRDPTTVTVNTVPTTIGLITLTNAAYTTGSGAYGTRDGRLRSSDAHSHTRAGARAAWEAARATWT